MLGFLLILPTQLLTQSVSVTGQILHGGRNNRPLVRQWAVLHEIRRDTSGPSGPVDSARTDGAGRYRLRLSRVDTAALYLVSTLYQDVAYFSAAVRVEGRGGADAEPLVVYDTTAAGPPLRLERRLVTLFRSGARGGRDVLELLEISNPGTRTRIAPDSLSPVWTVALPPGAAGWEAGEGDLSPEAVWLRDGSVRVFAPIWPGAPRQTSYRYSVGGSTVIIPLDQRTEELDLLVEDSTAQLTGAPFDSLGTYEIEGRGFAAYRAGPLDAGSAVTVTFSRGPIRAEHFVPYIAGVAALALAWGLWVALKRKPSAVSRQLSAGNRS